ncbi:uncharacterized protein N7487_001012, partial [Penicillium crustosum]|uniref:uncharacterized protein n=1 Tax=Penicillium crustosum TaxID=36656 RepID=UPI00238F03CC
REGKDTSAVRGMQDIQGVQVNGLEGEDEDSLVVTHPTTNSPACGLSTAERTGSPVFHTLWSVGLWKREKAECTLGKVRISLKLPHYPFQPIVQ